MGHSNGKITAPVNTDDVSATLGVNSHDVKTLCLSDRIKAAAIYRPRFTGGAVHVDPEDFHTRLKDLAAPTTGISGVTMKCIKYGIWVPYFNSLLSGWPWYASRIRWNVRPCDETQYGDITHFIGYDHNAKFVNPVQEVVCAAGSKIQVSFKDNTTAEWITAQKMFGDNEDAYFGFIVYEYTGEAPILTGTAAVTPKVFISNYYISQSSVLRVVSSNINATLGKSYDIIPIVAIDKGGGDYDYYSLFIGDPVPGLIQKRLGSDGIEFIYFRFSEGGFYPDGDTIETGTSVGVDKTTFAFVLMMSSPFPKILADSDTAYATGLIRPGTIKMTARFTRASDSKVFSNVFTESNGLVVLRQLATPTLKMYMKTTDNGNSVYDWAKSEAGTLAGDFDFEIAFTINVNTTGGSEKNTYRATSWMNP